MTASVRLQRVVHRYGNTLALAGVDLEIPANCMAGVIGPDGVGKSTLLALCAGARRRQSGTIHTLGFDLARSEQRRSAHPRIAYMPQGLGRNLYPTLSTRDNLDFFGRLFGQPRRMRQERVTELLAATGLLPFAERPAGKLSGGMKQKLGLCCALIHDPELLILDEPTSGVDPLSRRQFWQLLERIRARHPGLSVLVATAYMEEADGFDWLACIHAGKVLDAGSPAQLKRATNTTSLERAFVALLPQRPDRPQVAFEASVRARSEGPAAIEAEGLTCRFGAFTAVDGVSFRIERAEIFGFLGSNGCGKTTTMKMLTGLLPASEGRAALFGRPLNVDDLQMRRRVGYMSQSFSLYQELTVRQNLELHARLFHLPKTERPARVAEVIERFELVAFLDQHPASLPLGIRQRLQLAAAVIHRPEILILDEPTSGVDPVARDRFWELLLGLSRHEGVTVFISTHFMNEAERCDRVSLMHAGKVLAQGTPDELKRARGASTLEDAFVGHLEDAAGVETSVQLPAADAGTPQRASKRTAGLPPRLSLRRLWACTTREAVELWRDPIRLSFALLSPPLLMIVFGYGINFDVDHLPYAVLDMDRSAQSREYLARFAASRYFEQRPALADHAALERRMLTGELKLAVEIPNAFGRDLLRGARPAVRVWIDASMPSKAETSRGYVQSLHASYLQWISQQLSAAHAPLPQLEVAVRYRYNPELRSVNAIVPGVIMLLLVLIPAMLTAVGVVREKELGSITNLYATPVRVSEFLIGKQLPYVAVAMLSFASLMLLARFLFGVPVRGSVLVLVLGTLLYVIASTGVGLLISSFAKTQAAALFAAGILTTVPAISFSGMLTPTSSLSGGGRVFGLSFPSSYYQAICLGTLTKHLGWSALRSELLALAGFAVVFVVLSIWLVRGQEP
jgi:ribosome-dependent ATPase